MPELAIADKLFAVIGTADYSEPLPIVRIDGELAVYDDMDEAMTRAAALTTVHGEEFEVVRLIVEDIE